MDGEKIMNSENQTNNPNKEIIEDLKNDFTQNESNVVTNEIQNTVEVIPSFLPLPLVKLSVVGKNAAIVHYLSKNLPMETKNIFENHFKPTEQEIDLYRRLLEGLIWKHFRQVADWFMNNKTSTVMGEVILFETVRVAPLLSLVKQQPEMKEENKKQE